MLNYNSPIEGQASTIDVNDSEQLATFKAIKKALIAARDHLYFGRLSSTINIPKYMGKSIRVHEYLPILDDRNTNDMGIDATGAVIANGNLYGSSRDIGTITGAMPVLSSEEGGRVNRVGFTRLLREGTIKPFGIFTDFTQAALNFDSDEMLMEHIATEIIVAATSINEASLQMALINGADTKLYGGVAVSRNTITGEPVDPSVLSYSLLSNLSGLLTDRRCPKQAKMSTGTLLTDTETIPAARFAYVGSEMRSSLEALVDLHGKPAFIPVQKYGAGISTVHGEIGSVGELRFIENPQMFHWAGGGANVVDVDTIYRTSTVAGTLKYDVYPILVVGSDSFTSLGFEISGNSSKGEGSVKININTRMPGKDNISTENPYGLTGFTSAYWYGGELITRPERLGLVHVVVPR